MLRDVVRRRVGYGWEHKGVKQLIRAVKRLMTEEGLWEVRSVAEVRNRLDMPAWLAVLIVERAYHRRSALKLVGRCLPPL